MKIFLNLAIVIVAVIADVLLASDLRIIYLDPGVPNVGRLEIRPAGEDWGAICKSGWGDVDAQVACRQMGFTGVGQIIPRAEDIGTSNLPYHYERFRCVGTEATLDDCVKQSNPTCASGRDSGIICTNLQGSCAAGSYWPMAIANPSCTLCPVGTYQFRSDQPSCIPCPGRRTTFGEGTASRGECYEFYGNFDMNAPDRSINALPDNLIFMPYFGKRTQKLQMLHGTVIGWYVEVASTEPVDLVFWRDIGNDQYEYVGGTTVQFATLGEHYYEVPEADQFHVQNGDSIGVTWHGGPVVTRSPIDCEYRNSFRYRADNYNHRYFQPGDTLQIHQTFIRICVSFYVQAVVQRYYP